MAKTSDVRDFTQMMKGFVKKEMSSRPTAQTSSSRLGNLDLDTDLVIGGGEADLSYAVIKTSLVLPD